MPVTVKIPCGRVALGCGEAEALGVGVTVDPDEVRPGVPDPPDQPQAARPAARVKSASARAWWPQAARTRAVDVLPAFSPDSTDRFWFMNFTHPTQL